MRELVRQCMNSDKKRVLSISSISVFCLFLLILVSMNPWFVWNYKKSIAFVLAISFLFLRFLLMTKKHSLSKPVIFIIVIAILLSFMIHLRSGGNIIFGLFRLSQFVLLLAFVLKMNIIEKRRLVSISTNLYSWLVGISIVAYLLVLNGVSLPYSIIEVPDNDFYPTFVNYKFFISFNYSNSLISNRFQSIFTEPGHLGMFSAIFLYINNYNIKRKSVLIIFVSLLMSLSLGGYVLLVLGYFLHIITISEKSFFALSKIFLIVVLLGCIGFYFFKNHQDSNFSLLILNRLELDEDKGIAGNNRTSNNFDLFYKTQFLTSTKAILWGKGSEKDELSFLKTDGSYSYKTFLLYHGSVTLLLLFFLYFGIVSISPSKLGYGLLILYCLSFLQRPNALGSMQLFLFVGAVQCFFIEQNVTSVRVKNH